MQRGNTKDLEAFRAMFNPRSVAVVGASTQSGKIGNFVLRSVLASSVDRVYPVHAGGADRILGVKAYASIDAIPDDQVDLFLFAVPQQHILPSFEAAVAKGCRAAVIFTAGFREAGEGGRRDQEILKKLANDAGVKIIGPNTMGFYDAHSGINATFMPVLSDLLRTPGNIALVSQSGGVAGFGVIQFVENHVPLGTLVCLGNRANVEFADMLYYFAQDPHTSVIALFIEGLDDLRHFFEAARYCAAVKPVVVLGAGYTDAGRKVAKSHTGSMAVSQALYEAAFRQAGLLQVRTVEELVDTAKILAMSPPLKGNRVGMITHTAGPAVLASDILAKHGLVLADLDDTTKKTLISEKMLAPFTPPTNPVDLTTFGYLDRRLYVEVLDLMGRDSNVDATLAICISGLGDPNVEPFPMRDFGKVATQYGKPVAVVWGAPVDAHQEFTAWMEAGVPAYPTAERAATALANLCRASKRKKAKESRESLPSFPKELVELVHKKQSSGRYYLLEHEAKQILELAGIRTTRSILAVNEDEAVFAARQIGYPVALKIASVDIVHKSDVGGVMLGISDEEMLRRSFRRMMESVAQRVPSARIEGICVQNMVPPGTEIIVGGVRDPQAGPVVMFGLGGIWVEMLKDVVFRLAPITKEDAWEMIEEIQGASILDGFRGSKPVNKKLLVQLIVAISHIMDRLPIQELDCNPIIFHDDIYTVADVRMVISRTS